MQRNKEFLTRYSRQIAMPEIGTNGQSRLGESKVLIVGIGGLGSAAALYLAAGGIGTLGLVDHDVVELSNLHRQIIYSTSDIGQAKTSASAERLHKINPHLRLNLHALLLTPALAPDLIPHYDFVIEATDNFQAKFFVADACHAAGRPYSHAGILEFFGQTMTVIPGRTSCYRCIFCQPPQPETPVHAPRGPLGVVPGVIGAIQATEAVKYLLGLGELLTDRLLTYDALSMKLRTIQLNRNPYCILCGHNIN